MVITTTTNYWKVISYKKSKLNDDTRIGFFLAETRQHKQFKFELPLPKMVWMLHKRSMYSR